MKTVRAFVGLGILAALCLAVIGSTDSAIGAETAQHSVMPLEAAPFVQDEDVKCLQSALENMVGDGTYTASPLAAGLESHPDNWRDRVRRPETLPHYPMILHRGGYPDGS